MNLLSWLKLFKRDYNPIKLFCFIIWLVSSAMFL